MVKLFKTLKSSKVGARKRKKPIWKMKGGYFVGTYTQLNKILGKQGLEGVGYNPSGHYPVPKQLKKKRKR